MTGHPPFDPPSSAAADLRKAAAERRRLLAALEAASAFDDEAAGRDLFRALPRLRPASGFADRVLQRLAPRAWWNRSWVRGGLAAAMAAAALTIALLGPLALPIVSWIGPGGAIDFVVGGFADLIGRFAAGLAAWGPLASAARALGRGLAEPRLFALLCTQFLISALALRGLAGLSSSRRSPVHVAS